MSGLRPELEVAINRLHPGVRWRPLAGDASTRRFFRLFLAQGGSRILMDYGQPFASESDDSRLAKIFSDAELPAAEITAMLPDAGALVLSDLGDRSLESALLAAKADPAAFERLYAKAVDLAAAIAVRGTRALRRSSRAAGPALDAERFRFEMSFFIEHYVEGLLGRKNVAPSLGPALFELADRAAATPRVMCHRDFHCRNIMVLSDGALAMVDIQDARWGPDTYDLASLLRDAYMDLEEELVVELVERYRSALPDPPEPTAFRSRFDVVAAERMVKALGTFGYQIHIRGQARYRDAIPRTLNRLRHFLPAMEGGSALLALLDGAEALTLPPAVPPESVRE